MAEQNVGNTALGAAVCRLIEQYQPEETRLFTDPVLRDLVGAPVRMLMRLVFVRNFTVKQTDTALPGLYGAQVCRARYIDDAVEAALSYGVGQVVILGAGLDTRPYRLPGIERAKTFEVDLPFVQEGKVKKLRKRFGRLPENVTYVPIDFNAESLEAVLTKTAFDTSRPAIFIWEGVTQYLPRDAVRRTLTVIGRSAPGSVLVFTYVLKSIIERQSDIPGADRMMNRVEKSKAPWLFGLDPSEVRTFLQPFNLQVMEDVGNADYQARYLKPLRRQLAVSEAERIVRATVVRP
ncbi:MAG TPA: class I SAM-dependent methyltransferase [Methanocella sp.]|nr:class I SAM-dependent methyltransferase [Methanocella sp.]